MNNNLAWFSKNTVIGSSYSDLNRASTTNFWGAVHGGNIGREFYISHNHGGCEVDAGWLIADSASGTDPCEWEKPENALHVLYSTSAGFENWTTGNVAMAGSMEVYAWVPEEEWHLAYKITD